MYKNYPTSLENVLQERNISQLHETTEESSSRTCTSTNTSKSETNEQSSLLIPLKDENCILVLTASENDATCTLSNLSSSVKQKKIPLNNEYLSNKRRVAGAWHENVTTPEGNSINIESYECAYQYRRRNHLEDLILSPYFTKTKSCETCGTLHNGSFASGRFCSSRCARTVGGLARKRQRLRNKNKENNEGNASKDKLPTSRKHMENKWTAIPFRDSLAAPNPRKNCQNGSTMPWTSRDHQMEKAVLCDQQHFQIAASLCSLENMERMQKTNDHANKHILETGFHYDDNALKTMKEQHTKIDIASLLN